MRYERLPGLYYQPRYVDAVSRNKIIDWLASIHPLWEMRYSTHSPLPAGKVQRPLLRPVYWLGGWQFACLDYYRPPKGTLNRCIQAEPFPAVLVPLIAQAERITRQMLPPTSVPPKWKLNTCLVNMYGDRLQDGKTIDCARVGEHKDFEPGPVASISLGERAIFQFVSSRGQGSHSQVAYQQWLEDGSLQIFGGRHWKDKLFHRVQRVERKKQHHFPLQVEGFATRRINFTFRYVPSEHIQRFADLPDSVAESIDDYMAELAEHSPFFASEYRARVTKLESAPTPAGTLDRRPYTHRPHKTQPGA